MNQEMNRINRLGGQIINIFLLSFVAPLVGASTDNNEV